MWHVLELLKLVALVEHVHDCRLILEHVEVVWGTEQCDHERICAVVLREPVLLVTRLTHLVCAHDHRQIVLAQKSIYSCIAVDLSFVRESCSK